MSEFDLGAMMRQAQMLREQMETMQKSLDKEIVEGTAGGGMVKAKASGTQQLLSLELTPRPCRRRSSARPRPARRSRR